MPQTATGRQEIRIKHMCDRPNLRQGKYTLLALRWPELDWQYDLADTFLKCSSGCSLVAKAALAQGR
jgi:hypothetical protein